MELALKVATHLVVVSPISNQHKQVVNKIV